MKWKDKKGAVIDVTPGKKPPRKIQEEKKKQALALLASGASTRTAARAVGIRNGVAAKYRQELMRVFPGLADVEHYRRHRADIIDVVAERSLKSMMSEEKHATATLRDAAYAVKVANEMSRLERGLSTANQAVFVQVNLPGSLSLPTPQD